MKQNTGAARGARIAVRLSREDRDRIDGSGQSARLYEPECVHPGGNPERTERAARADRDRRSDCRRI